MQPVESAVIAAAGLGSRLGHGLPKCMLELGGQTLLTRIIKTLQESIRRVHVVVGYREDLVINLCANLHRDIVIVRNPDFRTTNTIQSMAIGARGCTGKTLFMDADLVIRPSSLRAFLDEATSLPVLAAIARSQSENPVNVELVGDELRQGAKAIARFTREPGHDFEWANVVAGPARMLDGATGYVYETLASLTPLASRELDLREIDTTADLELARQFAMDMDE